MPVRLKTSFAYVKRWGCPLITCGTCELCGHILGDFSPESYAWENQDGFFSPEKMLNNRCVESWRKKRKVADKDQLGLDQMPNVDDSDQVFSV